MKYLERRLTLSADRLSVAATLAASSPTSNVLYENRGVVGWAEGEHATVTAYAGRAVVGDEVFTGPPIETIPRALRRVDVTDWRAYGFATFELSHTLHGLDVAPDTEAACLLIPSREVRLDGDTALLRAFTTAELDELEERVAAAALAPSGVPAERVKVNVEDHAAEAYRTAVATGVADIRAGKLDKVILSRLVPVPTDIDLASTYLTGRRANNPARSFLLSLGGWEAAGFSPEIVIRVTAYGDVITQPLAGTRAFFGEEELDRVRRDELYRDAKEVFEHAISVRLAAIELSSVCTPSTVRVDEFMTVKERGSVQHLASELSGRLAPGRTSWDAFGALFPAVTASGIPKAPSCDLIRRAEPPRGLYSGAVLTVDSSGAIDAALVLRSVFRHNGRAWLRAGAGIVAQSTPDRELEETREKLRSVSRYLVPTHQFATATD